MNNLRASTVQRSKYLRYRHWRNYHYYIGMPSVLFFLNKKYYITPRFRGPVAPIDIGTNRLLCKGFKRQVRRSFMIVQKKVQYSPT